MLLGSRRILEFWNFPKSSFFFCLDSYSIHRKKCHPSISTNAFPAVTLVGLTEPVTAAFVQRKGAPWTGCQFDAGPTQTQPSALTPMDNILYCCQLPWCSCLWTLGGSQSTMGEPRTWENMQTPHSKAQQPWRLLLNHHAAPKRDFFAF